MIQYADYILAQAAERGRNVARQRQITSEPETRSRFHSQLWRSEEGSGRYVVCFDGGKRCFERGTPCL